MSGLVNFVSDPKVHDSVLLTMAVTAILSALPKKFQDWHISSLYDVPYQAVMTFWSLKTGAKQPDPPNPILPETPAKTQTQS